MRIRSAPNMHDQRKGMSLHDPETYGHGIEVPRQIFQGMLHLPTKVVQNVEKATEKSSSGVTKEARSATKE